MPNPISDEKQLSIAKHMQTGENKKKILKITVCLHTNSDPRLEQTPNN